MYLFGLSSVPVPRALISLLALSSSSSSSSSNNKESKSSISSLTPSVVSTWEDLVNKHICSALERQSHFEDYYANVLGDPGWSLDLDPVTGRCKLTFTGADTTNSYQCQLVGSESHQAQSFMWAIPQDPTQGIPHQLSTTNEEVISNDIQDAIFQTRKEIPMTPTINGYSIALLAGALLPSQPAKAVFLGPYGDNTGLLYLVITDDEFPTLQEYNPVKAQAKMERIKTFANMVATVPFVTHHQTAFEAFCKDVGGLTTRIIPNKKNGKEEEEEDELIKMEVMDDESRNSDSDNDECNTLTVTFDPTGKRMTQLGDLLLLTNEEMQILQQQQQQQQQSQSPQQQLEGDDAIVAQEQAKTKTGQLQLLFFQKILDESITSQRTLFIECAKSLGLKVTQRQDPDNDNTPLVEAYDVEAGNAMLGHFDHDDKMTRLGNIKK